MPRAANFWREAPVLDAPRRRVPRRFAGKKYISEPEAVAVICGPTMTRVPLVSVVLAFAASGVRFACAEEAANATQPPAPSATPVLVTRAPPTPPAATKSSPARPRAISPALAAQLSALGPKFDPAVAVAASKPIEPGTDLREIDKPRNTIIRLPNFEVQEEKIIALQPRELLTPPERLRLAFKKYPGLHVGSLPFFSNAGVALMMQAEDERVERMKEMEDLLSLLPVAQKKQVKPMVDDAFARKPLPR